MEHLEVVRDVLVRKARPVDQPVVGRRVRIAGVVKAPAFEGVVTVVEADGEAAGHLAVAGKPEPVPDACGLAAVGAADHRVAFRVEVIHALVTVPDAAHRTRGRQRVERALDPNQLAEAVAAVRIAELRPPPAPQDVGVEVADDGLAALDVAAVLEVELLTSAEEVLLLKLDTPVRAVADQAGAAADLERPLVVGLDGHLDPAVDAAGRDQHRVDEAELAQDAGALLGQGFGEGSPS